MSKENTVLVTGAPGWLGTRLVEELRKKGNKVRVLALKGSYIKPIERTGAEIITGNVLDKSSIEKTTKGVKTVVHCAGIIHPKKAADFYRINVDGTRNVLESSANSGVGKFIFISSNSAQGVNKDRNSLFTEKDKPRPYTDYGKSKYLAENVVKDYQRSGKIKTTILRPCWFYGPRPPLRLIKLIQMIRDGKPMIFGDGHNLRSMTYVDNLVDAIILVIKNSKSDGQTYWITDEKPYETLEIYSTIADYFGVKLRPRYIPGLVSYMMEKVDIILGKLGIYEINLHVGGEMRRDIACNIEKAKKELGFNPKVGLKVGMKNTIEWCQEAGLI